MGRTHIDVDDFQRHLGLPDTELLAGTNLEEAWAALRDHDVDHMILGAGIDLDTRVAIVRAAFEASDTVTVHLKDTASGKEGMLPFVRAVLRGLHDEANAA